MSVLQQLIMYVMAYHYISLQFIIRYFILFSCYHMLLHIIICQYMSLHVLPAYHICLFRLDPSFAFRSQFQYYL